MPDGCSLKVIALASIYLEPKWLRSMGPGPNSEQILKIGPEWGPELEQNIGNPYQMEDKKAAPSAPPKGAALRAAPLGFDVFHLVRISYVLHHFRSPFWADFPNLSELGPRPLQDLKSYNRAFLFDELDLCLVAYSFCKT